MHATLTVERSNAAVLSVGSATIRTKGGPTVLSNLVLLCWKHHKLVHEQKWSLRGEAGPHVEWIRPDGTPFEPRVRVSLDTC